MGDDIHQAAKFTKQSSIRGTPGFLECLQCLLQMRGGTCRNFASLSPWPLFYNRSFPSGCVVFWACPVLVTPFLYGTTNKPGRSLSEGMPVFLDEGDRPRLERTRHHCLSASASVNSHGLVKVMFFVSFSRSLRVSFSLAFFCF